MRKRRRDVPNGVGGVPKGVSQRGRSRKQAVPRRKSAVDPAKKRPAVDPPFGRSGLERKFAGLLRDRGIDFRYEQERISYVVPETKHKYTPDFEIDGKYFETKGKFTSVDRKKMLLVQEQNDMDTFYMVFPKPQNKLRKGSPTTYASWCNKNMVRWISLEEFEQVKNKKDLYDLLRRAEERLGV